MAAKRRPERDKAFEIWRDSNKMTPLKDIAERLGVAETLIRKWKCQDKWDKKTNGNVGAHDVGLKVGAYHYSYALTPDDAIKEANNCRETIDSADVLLELPVFFDMEDADGYKQRNGFSFEVEETTSICKSFIDNLGLDCGVYASYSWLTDKIDWQSLCCMECTMGKYRRY